MPGNTGEQGLGGDKVSKDKTKLRK